MTMRCGCFVVGCTSLFWHRGLRWSEFPKDDARAVQWRKALRNKIWEPVELHRICSKHFVSGVRSNDPLSEDFVPTLNLGHEEGDTHDGKQIYQNNDSVDKDMENTNFNKNGTYHIRSEGTICSLKDDCSVNIDHDAEKEMKEMRDENIIKEYPLKSDTLDYDRRDADSAYENVLGKKEMYIEGKEEIKDSEEEVKEEMYSLYRREDSSFLDCTQNPLFCDADADIGVDFINNKHNDGERQIIGNISTEHDNNNGNGVDGYRQSGVDCERVDNDRGKRVKGSWNCGLNGNINKADTNVNGELNDNEFSHGYSFVSTAGGATLSELDSSCDFKLGSNSNSKPQSVIIHELDGGTLIEVARKCVSKMLGYINGGQFGTSVIKPDVNNDSGPVSVSVPGSESVRDSDSERVSEVVGEKMCEQDGNRIMKQDSDIPSKQDSYSTSEKDSESDDNHSWVTADCGEEVIYDNDGKSNVISFKETSPLADKSDKEVLTLSAHGCCPLVTPVSMIQNIGDCKIHKSKIVLYCSSCKIWACEYCLPEHDLKSQQDCLKIYASHALQEIKEEMAGRGFLQINNMKKLKDQLLNNESELVQLVSLMRKDLQWAEEKQEAILTKIHKVRAWIEKLYEEQINFLSGKTVHEFEEAKEKYTRLETEAEMWQKLIEEEAIDDVQKTKQVESWLETVHERWETSERDVSDSVQKKKQVVTWLENVQGLGVYNSICVVGIERIRNKLGIMKSVYAVHKTDKELLWGKLSIHDNFLLLHAFMENVPSEDAVFIPFEEVRNLARDYLPKTFMDLEWHNFAENRSYHESRVIYSLTGKIMNEKAWHFLLLCSGELGISYKNSILVKSKSESGVLFGGKYKEKNGFGGGGLASVNCSDYGVRSKVKFPGLVFGASANDSPHMGQFNIQIIRSNISRCATGFGKVETGLTVLRSVYFSSSYSETRVKDCGVVYDLF